MYVFLRACPLLCLMEGGIISHLGNNGGGGNVVLMCMATCKYECEWKDGNEDSTEVNSHGYWWAVRGNRFSTFLNTRPGSKCHI